MKIGFIGLGIMGGRMAANLQQHDHQLVIHNRTRDKAAALLENGATWADTPAEVARQTDLVFTMLAHPQAVTEVALGEHGLLTTLPAGTLWVDCSTGNPAFARQMAAEASARDVRFLDAPVTGSKNQAAGAQLVFFVGGAESNIDRCRPLFEAMGRAIIHVGEHGMGTALKMVVNLLLGVSMAAFAEGMALGQALGISQEMLFKVLLGGPVVAPFIAAKREKIEQGDYPPEFPLRWLQKDLHMAAIAAWQVGVPMPLGNASKEVYQMAIQQGLGEQDFSAIYHFLDQRI